MFQPGRDDDLAFRFGVDPGVTALLCSAFVLWPLGEVDRAGSFVDRAEARLAANMPVGALVAGRHLSALFALMRRDRVRAAQNALELAWLLREHELTMYRAFAMFLEGWAKGETGRLAQDSRTCGAASNSFANKTFCFTTGS